MTSTGVVPEYGTSRRPYPRREKASVPEAAGAVRANRPSLLVRVATWVPTTLTTTSAIGWLVPSATTRPVTRVCACTCAGRRMSAKSASSWSGRSHLRVTTVVGSFMDVGASVWVRDESGSTEFSGRRAGNDGCAPRGPPPDREWMTRAFADSSLEVMNEFLSSFARVAGRLRHVTNRSQGAKRRLEPALRSTPSGPEVRKRMRYTSGAQRAICLRIRRASAVHDAALETRCDAAT